MSVVVIEHGEGARFRVKARPNAQRTALAGLHEGALKVQLNAAPEKGKANKALIAFLAKALGVTKRDLRLVSGETARDKTLALVGSSVVDLQARLERLLKTERA